MKAALLCEAAWGKCDRGSAVPLERLGKVRFLLFPMFHPVLLHSFLSGSSIPDLNSEGKIRLETQFGMDFSPCQERSCSCCSAAVGL